MSSALFRNHLHIIQLTGSAACCLGYRCTRWTKRHLSTKQTVWPQICNIIRLLYFSSHLSGYFQWRFCTFNKPRETITSHSHFSNDTYREKILMFLDQRNSQFLFLGFEWLFTTVKKQCSKQSIKTNLSLSLRRYALSLYPFPMAPSLHHTQCSRYRYPDFWSSFTTDPQSTIFHSAFRLMTGLECHFLPVLVWINPFFFSAALGETWVWPQGSIPGCH